MFSIKNVDGKISLWLDGPQSLLKQSTRYGMQLAIFFPGLLLLPSPWQANATILWKNKRKKFSLDHTCGIQSHYQQRGVWRSKAEQTFEERFRNRNTEWTLKEGELLHLQGQRILIPDFTAYRKGTKVHIEIIGFWRKGQLGKFIKECPKNLILLVSKRLAGDASKVPAEIASRIVLFSEVIPVPKVLAALESCASS